MTRITIWETPDNREQYADVACEYEEVSTIPPYTCGEPLREHGELFEQNGFHPWRIYRDTETAAVPERKLPPCGRRECRVSTGIDDGVTAGIGEPDHNGFFAKPCAICEDYFSKRLNDTAAPTTTAEPATEADEYISPDDADVARRGSWADIEREQTVRPRTSTIRRLSVVVTYEFAEAYAACHGTFYPCKGHLGLRLCHGCGELRDEVHFHNEAIV